MNRWVKGAYWSGYLILGALNIWRFFDHSPLSIEGWVYEAAAFLMSLYGMSILWDGLSWRKDKQRV